MLVALAVIYSMLAGAINGSIASAVGSSFSQQLLISVTTGVISFAGIVIAAIIAGRSNREAHELAAMNAQTLLDHSQALSDIKSGQGVVRRRTDRLDAKRDELRDDIGDDALLAQDTTDAALEHEREDARP